MSSRISSLQDMILREEYTGENRCMPCTIVNLLIAAGLSMIAGWIQVELGVAVLVGSILLIYLRGYLVPGTPTLTKRYLPNRVLAAFDKGPESHDETEWETLEKLEAYRENTVDAESFLQEIGAIEPCEMDTEVCFTSNFNKRLREELETLKTENTDTHPAEGNKQLETGLSEGTFTIEIETISAIYDTSPSSIRVEERDYPAVRAGRRIRKWPSEEALAIDAALYRALETLSPRWDEVPLKQRVEILRELRGLVRQCPGCGGAVGANETVVESCCATYDVVAVQCLDCGAHLLEKDPEKSDEGIGGFNP